MSHPETTEEDIMRGEERKYTRQEADRRSNITGAPIKPEWATETGTTNMAPGTSIFDPLLCELIYKWFCPDGGTVLDPFAGGSVRGIVASILDYNYIGIDLSKPQIEANKRQAQKITPDKQPQWIVGNSYEMDTLLLQGKQYDLIFTCPPYHDLEQYTDDMDDLSNMSWDTFKRTYSQIIAKSILRLKDNRFACFVVGEVRDKIGGYKGLVPLTITAFTNGGMRYYNEIILVNVVGSLPIRIAGQFAYRKIGKTHQNILIFYKGNIALIPRYFKPIDTTITSPNGGDVVA
ncbi:RsmD family RNA methyltransferase [Patescibacteria group bacterium]|nr:RsmD family RNA methyltransferase [Patescibacteria group bacterium]